MSRRTGRWWSAGVLTALSTVGLVATFVAERGTEQRANRLHRGGALPEALVLYGTHIEEDSAAAHLRYNLGTTLLDLDMTTAHAELTRGAASSDEGVRARAFYNLGLWSLRRALEAEATDSARAHAASSVEASKGVLRIEPQRLDARWNLALAQRMLDSIDADDGRAGEESVDGASDADQLVETNELRDIEDDGVEEGPDEGEDETLAQSDELDPLSPLEAEEILGSGHLDATLIITKLLAFEGRNQRMRRGTTTGPRW